jgi:archaemetzincin
VIATAGFAEALPAGIGIPVRRARECGQEMDSEGRLRAEWIVRTFAPSAKSGFTLILTGRDLCAGDREWVYGYSDRRRGVAVVSTCRLRRPGDPGVTERRLAGVIAHEWGHLRGLAHCAVPGCVMHPCRDATELDARGITPCGSCPSRLRPLPLAAALAAGLALFAALDLLGGLLHSSRRSPFSVVAAQAGRPARISFNRRPVIDLPTRCSRPRELEGRLNSAYHSLALARFDVTDSAAGSAFIRLNGVNLLEVSAADASARTPKALAEQWSGTLRELVDGKGWAWESCPECHTFRHSEVVAWAEARKR